jgi:hypothetical protein
MLASPSCDRPPAGFPGSARYGSVMQLKRDLPERASKKGRFAARAFKSLQKKRAGVASRPLKI